MRDHLQVLHRHMLASAQRAEHALGRGESERPGLLMEASALYRFSEYLHEIAPDVEERSANLFKHARWFFRKTVQEQETGDRSGNLRDLLRQDLPAMAQALQRPHVSGLFSDPPLLRNPRLCFVAMPFREELKPFYTGYIRPAIQQAGLECIRVDEVHELGSIVDQIWKYISRAGLVVADLSGCNPNVMYELGLAHALQTPVVPLAREGERLPFDVGHIRTLFYTPTPEGMNRLQQTLTEYLVHAHRQYA